MNKEAHFAPTLGTPQQEIGVRLEWIMLNRLELVP